jgi:hypothetical protein
MGGAHFYSVGRSHRTGYLEQLGLPSTAFPLSVDDAIYHGVAIAVVAAVETVGRWGLNDKNILFLVIGSAVLLFVIRHFVRKYRGDLTFTGWKLQGWMQARLFRAHDHIENAAASYAIAATPALVASVALLILFALVYVGYIWGESAGRDKARRELTSFNRQVVTQRYPLGSQFVRTTDGRSRRLLMCGPYGCAAMDVSGPTFLTWGVIRESNQVRPANSGSQ